jgi:N-acetylmuramoyl-L-alanine amidase
VCLLILSPFSASAATQLQDIRVWHSPDRSRVVLDLSEQPQYKTFFLQSPARFVVDIARSKSAAKLPLDDNTGQFLKRFRSGVPKPGVTRLVMDLRQSVNITVLLLKPAAGYNYRLVFDVMASNVAVKAQAQAPKAKAPETPATQTELGNSKPTNLSNKIRGPLIVAIDAGHGGEDTGALGKHSTEKSLVLAIAKRLKSKIDKQPNMQAFLVREGDYFIALRKRISLARTRGAHPADLFVSIHADGFRSAKARGSSVYTLSSTGASSEEARWLANKENAADLAGGVSIADRDETLVEVLLDMSMSNTNHESILFAKSVLSELKKIGKVHKKNVEKAGFVVLKSPDIPSILVETAFITNPHEEKLLRSSSHQEKLANAILNGVRNFVKKSPTLSARMAP